MPLRWINNQLVLECVNAHPQEEYMPAAPQERVFSHVPGPVHQMVNLQTWAFVPTVQAPDAEGRIVPNKVSLPLRVYACTTCGYTETYLATVVEPELWRRAQ
jgi:hypothetical protein